MDWIQQQKFIKLCRLKWEKLAQFIAKPTGAPVHKFTQPCDYHMHICLAVVQWQRWESTFLIPICSIHSWLARPPFPYIPCFLRGSRTSSTIARGTLHRYRYAAFACPAPVSCSNPKGVAGRLLCHAVEHACPTGRSFKGPSSDFSIFPFPLCQTVDLPLLFFVKFWKPRKTLHAYLCFPESAGRVPSLLVER